MKKRDINPRIIISLITLFTAQTSLSILAADFGSNVSSAINQAATSVAQVVGAQSINKISVPPTNQELAISTLRGYLIPGTNFYILIDIKNNAPVLINAPNPIEAEIGDYAIPDSVWSPEKFKAIFIDSLGINIDSYESLKRPALHEDSEHIERLAGLGLLTPQNKAQYQKIMLFFIMKLGKTYYKFYINNPWPMVPGEVDRALSRYGLVQPVAPVASAIGQSAGNVAQAVQGASQSVSNVANQIGVGIANVNQTAQMQGQK